MGFWDEMKKIIKEFSLVKIKNEVHLHGDINIPFRGDTIHYNVPPDARIKIGSTEITQELQEKYDRKVTEYLKAKESQLASLPEGERSTQVAGTTVATAVEVLTTTTSTEPPKTD